MHCLDADVEVLVKIPSGADVVDSFTGRKRRHPAVVETHHIRCRRWDFAPIVGYESACDYRPRVRVGGGFAGTISLFEFRKGGVESSRSNPT